MRLTGVHQTVTTRELTHDDTICGYRLPKGTHVTLLSRAIHRKQEYWKDPFEFRPERWIEEKTPEMSKNLCAFSFGPRKCVGYQFAMVEMMLTIIYLLPKYKFRFINEDKKTLEELMDETYDIFVTMHDTGLYFEMESRY